MVIYRRIAPHDLPRLFIDALLGTAAPQKPARVGRRYAWLEGDLHGLVSCLVSGRIGYQWIDRNFASAANPAVHETTLQTARDMVRLVTPRVDILESHSIVNQRIRRLLDQAREQLDLALAARTGHRLRWPADLLTEA